MIVDSNSPFYLCTCFLNSQPFDQKPALSYPVVFGKVNPGRSTHHRGTTRGSQGTSVGIIFSQIMLVILDKTSVKVSNNSMSIKTSTYQLSTILGLVSSQCSKTIKFGKQVLLHINNHEIHD